MIVAVTGLPRSGTTLAMRMLYRGGFQVLADKNEAGEKDLKGFEDYRALLLPGNTSVISLCDNKAIKILHPLKYRLPVGPNYKFIYMLRDPKEMVKSQAKYLGRSVRQRPRDLKRYTFDAINVLNRYPNSDLIKVQFEDILKSPATEAHKMADFLGITMDIDSMVDCVMARGPECLPHMAEIGFNDPS